MGVTRHPLFAAETPLDGPEADRGGLRGLRASLLDALAGGDRLTEGFYGRLFARRPGLRALFPAELDAVACRFRAALALLLSPGRAESGSLDARAPEARERIGAARAERVHLGAMRSGPAERSASFGARRRR